MIVAYAYKGHNYCPECILVVMGGKPIERTESTKPNTELVLDTVALILGYNRSTITSDDFPEPLTKEDIDNFTCRCPYNQAGGDCQHVLNYGHCSSCDKEF